MGAQPNGTASLDVNTIPSQRTPVAQQPAHPPTGHVSQPRPANCSSTQRTQSRAQASSSENSIKPQVYS